MILGRNAGLWTGLGFAVLDVAAAGIVVATHQPIDPATAALFLALHALIVAVVGLVANASDPTTAPTFALTTQAPAPASSSPSSTATPAAPVLGSSVTTAGPSSGPSADGAGAIAAPATADPIAADSSAAVDPAPADAASPAAAAIAPEPGAAP